MITSEQINSVFPIITPERQRAYEQTAVQTGVRSADAVPCICGYYGRACRRMDNLKGANLRLCDGCALAAYYASKK